jgi:hypothetical protein
VTGGELNETSVAIGELKAGLAALRQNHDDKARKDEDFRKAGYEAFGALKHIAKTQEEHAAALKTHGDRLDDVDQRHSRQKGVMVALGAVGSAIMGAAGLLVQYVTSGPNGQ